MREVSPFGFRKVKYVHILSLDSKRSTNIFGEKKSGTKFSARLSSPWSFLLRTFSVQEYEQILFAYRFKLHNQKVHDRNVELTFKL